MKPPKQGGDAGTRRDSDDQTQLRTRVCDELQAVMNKYEVGGCVFIASRESAAWRFVIPKWAGLTIEGPGIRLRISSRTPALREVADSTMGMVGALRDMCYDAAMLFERLFGQAEQALGGPGSIEHRKLGIIEPEGD